MDTQFSHNAGETALQAMRVRMILLLALAALLGSVWHEHWDLDHHDCALCLLGAMPFLAYSLSLPLIFWILLGRVFLPFFIRGSQAAAPLTSSRAPPPPVQ